MKTIRNNKRRLAVDVDMNVHKHIKLAAIAKNQTMTEWILEAIDRQIDFEKKLGF